METATFVADSQIQCTGCGKFFKRALGKCPHCGALNTWGEKPAPTWAEKAVAGHFDDQGGNSIGDCGRNV